MRFWAPVLAAHTGMRAGELAGLMLSDIQLEGPYPHFHLRANELRGLKSGIDRYVPVLDILYELGFERYVAARRTAGDNRLFPDWTFPGRSDREVEGSSSWSNSKWIRAFNRTVLDQALPGVRDDVFRSPVTFHSFRGSFKTLLSSVDAGIYTNAVMGHSQDALDRAYLAKQRPEDLCPKFRSLVYPSVKFARLNDI